MFNFVTLRVWTQIHLPPCLQHKLIGGRYLALATQLFRVNVNTLRKSFVWQCSSQLFLSGLGHINQTLMIQIVVALHPLRFDGHHVSPSGVGLKVGAPIVMVPTNLVNGPPDNTWKLFRSVVVINNHVSRQLTSRI